MGRTTVAKIATLAATTAALVVFGASMAQADTSAPAGSTVTTTTTTVDPTPTPTPTPTDDNNPWD